MEMMETATKLYLKETEDTPCIHFDIDANIYSITGISVPENSHRIYDPVITWINEVLGNVKPPHDLITLEVNLKYFSTTSAKYLLKIITAYSNMCLYHQIKLTVNWYYHEEDEDMHDAGDLLHKLSGINFAFKQYTE
jgi:hypothetical protein